MAIPRVSRSWISGVLRDALPGPAPRLLRAWAMRPGTTRRIQKTRPASRHSRRNAACLLQGSGRPDELPPDGSRCGSVLDRMHAFAGPSARAERDLAAGLNLPADWSLWSPPSERSFRFSKSQCLDWALFRSLALQRRIVGSARLAAVGDLAKLISRSIDEPVARTKNELEDLSIPSSRPNRLVRGPGWDSPSPIRS